LHQPFVYQRLQKGSDVAAHCFRIYVMLARKTLKNFADAAGFGEHLPDFGCDLVEVEIRTGTHAQDNRTAVDVGRGQFVVPYNNAFDCEGQAAGLHCSAGKPAYLCPIRQR